MKTIYILIFALIYLVVFSDTTVVTKSVDINVENAKVDSVKYKTGQRIFKRNCSICHGFDKKLNAEPLNNVLTKHKSEWIYNYISDDKSFMAIDSTAARINTKGNISVTAHNFKNEISKKDFKALLYFIKAKSTK
jgi:mono/diheme cytochrome c family protein